MNTHPPRAEYTYGMVNDILWIEDVGKNTRSVTNDMINVLNGIIKNENLKMRDYRVVYRDSNGNWDGVVPHVETHGWVFAVDFYPLNTTDKDTAIKNAR